MPKEYFETNLTIGVINLVRYSFSIIKYNARVYKIYIGDVELASKALWG